MLSVAALGSSAQAGSYYGKDNYYTRDESENASQWFGRGAVELGLDNNEVDVHEFESILSGELPNGTIVGEGSHKDHRPGMDLTFSAPKTLSILGLVGGDDRLIRANMEAVKSTLAWAEANIAEARVRTGESTVEVVKTGNLVAALFAHDTSRSLDPQVHVHAVIANATQTQDGKWRALHNDKLWKNNSLLGAIYHNYLRERVEGLGYRTETVGKHGMFEIKGIDRDQVLEFSQRRTVILAKSEELGIESHKGVDSVATRTRDRKVGVDDREELYSHWREQAESVGIKLPNLIAQSEKRAGAGHTGPTITEPAMNLARNLRDKVDAVAGYLRELVGGKENDPYYVRPGALPAPRELAAAQAVSSAIHHLSERETSFTVYDIAAAALHLGLPTTIDRIEQQIGRLTDKGVLQKGVDGESFTTKAAIEIERTIIAASREGLSATTPIVGDVNTAGERLQASAMTSRGFTLNVEQESAGRHLLSSHDRIINIQGAAGVGKSTILEPTAKIMREEGINVIGLAVAHRVANDLRRETGIDSATVAKFTKTHERLLKPNADPARIELAREMFKNSAILVDEASMLSNDQAITLSKLANLLQVRLLAYIGDKRQLGAVEAGKPFEQSQTTGTPTVEVSKNIRAKTPDLLKAANLANDDKIAASFRALSNHTLSVGGQVGELTAQRWLALNPEARSQTIIMTSGRALMEDVNARVQDGLRAEGSISGPGRQIQIYDKVNATKEELKSPATYEAGMRIEFVSRPGDRHPNHIRPGHGTITSVDRDKETISIKLDTGRDVTLLPRQLPKAMKDAPIRLSRPRDITVHKGDVLRWTDSDPNRHIFNKDLTKVLKIDSNGVRITNDKGVEVTIPMDDPLLKRVDLAYALNTDQLQGATATNVISAALSTETNLANAKRFLVNITRPREGILILVDDAARYETRINLNRGEKTSALGTIGALPEPTTSRENILAAVAKLPERALDLGKEISRNRDAER